MSLSVCISRYRHYSTCLKPFPVFLSWGSAVTALVYGCQKPWLLPWQCHTAILRAGRLRLLQHRHKNRRQNGERCRRDLLNANQSLQFVLHQTRGTLRIYIIPTLTFSLYSITHTDIHKGRTRHFVLFGKLFMTWKAHLLWYFCLWVGEK